MVYLALEAREGGGKKGVEVKLVVGPHIFTKEMRTKGRKEGAVAESSGQL